MEIIIYILIKILLTKKIKNKIKEIKKKNIENGKYITKLANCISCHTINGGKPYSGGNLIKTKFGKIYTPNITFNKKYGIGKINLNEFKKNLIEGISKKNNLLLPAFPYINYKKIKKKNIKNMFIFLKTIPKIKIKNKNNKINFPIKYKSLILGWRLIFLKNKTKKKEKKEKSNIKRGKYIYKTLAHCDMCHNKINIIGRTNKFFKYKGETIIENWKTSNIANNQNIKNNKTKDIYKVLKEGISKKKVINGQMSEVINNSLQYINKIDIISIVRFLKNKANNNIIIKKNINKKIKNFKIKKEIFKKNCSKCHGKLNMGNFPIYPKLVKNKNNNHLKNIRKILKENKIVNTIKNKYPSIMPIFLKIKKNIKKYIKINKNLIINKVF